MNKYFAVFGYEQYYPCGGESDLRGCFATKAEAEEFVRSGPRHDYTDIVDLRDWIGGPTPEERKVILPALNAALAILEAAGQLILTREQLRDAVAMAEREAG